MGVLRIERIWRKEARKRAATQARRERINRNWPIHAERIALVFGAFADLAKIGGVRAIVTIPDDIAPLGQRATRSERAVQGSSAVILEFGLQQTGERFLNNSEDGRSFKIDYELGAKLVVVHSDADALVQVFFEAPRALDSERSEPLLYTYTNNTDDVTYEWVADLISNFLVFSRFESRLQDYNLADSARVRWWKFKDVRNRRGYLDSFQHILTPWELLIVALIAAIPGLAIIKMVWG
jgi:hypothetical protein